MKPKLSDSISKRRKVDIPAPVFADGVRKPRLSIGGTFSPSQRLFWAGGLSRYLFVIPGLFLLISLMSEVYSLTV